MRARELEVRLKLLNSSSMLRRTVGIASGGIFVMMTMIGVPRNSAKKLIQWSRNHDKGSFISKVKNP